MKVAFLGATKGMGRSLARLLAERGDRLFLLGRDSTDLERSAQRSRGARRAASAAGVGALRPRAARDLRPRPGRRRAGPRRPRHRRGHRRRLRHAGRARGRLPTRARRLLVVDFTNTVLFCEEARARLLARGGGTLCVFSSVAGERGRKPVVLYGAAKAGLTRYLEGLDHKFHAPGPARRLREARLREDLDDRRPARRRLSRASPTRVARRVLQAIDRGTPVVYAPPAWALGDVRSSAPAALGDAAGRVLTGSFRGAS